MEGPEVTENKVRVERARLRLSRKARRRYGRLIHDGATPSTIVIHGDAVVWTMSPTEAREMADFIEDHIEWRDLAHRDVVALRVGADLIDGPIPHALDVGDQHSCASPAPPNQPGCIICQGETRDGSDWCPDHLAELSTPQENPS